MDLNLAGRVVIVTGASKGIGYACAEAFAAEGARVALVSRSQANLDAALARFPRGASAPHRHRRRHDQAVTAAEAMVANEVEKALGDIDVLVNSAGAARRYAPDELNAQAWHDAMDAKFFSYIHPTDAVLKRMLAREPRIDRQYHRRRRQGRQSRAPAGRRRQRGAHAGHGGSGKRASGPKGIRVNGINPGATHDRPRTGRAPSASRG